MVQWLTVSSLSLTLFLCFCADMFIKTKAELEVQQMKVYNKEQEDIKHIKAFIASCGTYSNLVRQAKSKQKIIDKVSTTTPATPHTAQRIPSALPSSTPLSTAP